MSVSETELSEQRQFERRQLTELTWIFNPVTNDLVECSIINVSITGASLKVQEADALPDQFYLVMLGEEYSLECDVQWRSKTRLGIKFV